MKILVVGGGGREHALVWKINKSPLVKEIYCAPGNPGIATLAQCVEIAPTDLKRLLSFAEQKKIDLTVVGPEVPLAEGIVDMFKAAGLLIFGPEKKAAALEGDKTFAKDLLQELGVPTAKYRVFSDAASAVTYVKEQDFPLVIKAAGLAAGKGVIIAETLPEAEKAITEIITERIFGTAGNKLVVEDFLVGEEVSLLAFTDGEIIIPMISAQDHKAAYDGDQGPNTGGMGAYAPAPVLTPTLLDEVVENILKPVVQGLADKGINYQGILYAGLMLTQKGPEVLEFNVRFGDPETQAVLPLLKSDIVPVMLATAEGSLKDVELEWYPGSAACVVMAAGGYPGEYKKGHVITGIESADSLKKLVVFQAGTAFYNGQLVTAGGRVLGVTGFGDNLREALKRSYDAVEKISFTPCHYRRDIGFKAQKYS